MNLKKHAHENITGNNENDIKISLHVDVSITFPFLRAMPYRMHFTYGAQRGRGRRGSERIKGRRKSANYSTENISLAFEGERHYCSAHSSFGGEADFFGLNFKSMDITGQSFDFTTLVEPQEDEESRSSSHVSARPHKK